MMDKLSLIAGMCLFIAGWLGGSIADLSNDQSGIQSTTPLDTESYFNQLAPDQSVSVIRDKPSPKERISRSDVFVYDDQVILNIENPEWAVFADTKSMDPVID